VNARRIKAGIGRRIPRQPFRYVLPYRPVRGFVRFWLSVVAADPEKRRAMRRLLEVHQDAYDWVDLGAISYDGGVHAKHRLTGYHDFFVARVRPGERVLDVGCGKGELAADLAERAGATVVGIDVSRRSLEFARSHFSHPRLTFLEADALEYVPEEPFDVVVMSNVLEHLDPRVELLRRLARTTRTGRLLIRVPVLERDWTVPLQKELGLPYFSEPTHVIEYDPDSLRAELAEAGLEVVDLKQVWGELWAEVRPAEDRG
jgi:2-polyprenyl-3-methyl-5-hydroxy-6-metoxy-1,4-benzoquinol methylase